MALTPSQELAAWLRANQDKRGTPDYQTVLRGFQEAVLQESAEQAQPQTPTPQPQSGFMPALRSGIQGLMGAGAALAGRTGLMDMAEAEKAVEARRQRQAEIFKPTEEWGLTKLSELLGGSIPYMAAPLAAAGAAAALPVTGAAAVATGLGAAGLASATQFTGTNLSRQIEEGKKLVETDLGNAALAAVPMALLDTLALRMLPGVGKLLGDAGIKVTKESAKEVSEQILKKAAIDYAAATGRAMTVEGLTEAAQQGFERLQAGLSITDEDARKEYFDALVGGALLGGAIAPAGRMMERGKAKREIAAIEQEEATTQAAALREAEAKRKQDPEYLVGLNKTYQDLLAQKNALEAQIKKGSEKAPLSQEDKDANAVIDRQLAELKQPLKRAQQAFIDAGGPQALAKLRAEQPALPPPPAQLELTPPPGRVSEPTAAEPEEVPETPEAQRARLTRDMEGLGDLLKQYRADLKAAKTPEEAAVAAERIQKTSSAFMRVSKQFDALPKPPDVAKLQAREAELVQSLADAQKKGKYATVLQIVPELQQVRAQLREAQPTDLASEAYAAEEDRKRAALGEAMGAGREDVAGNRQLTELEQQAAREEDARNAQRQQQLDFEGWAESEVARERAEEAERQASLEATERLREAPQLDMFPEARQRVERRQVEVPVNERPAEVGTLRALLAKLLREKRGLERQAAQARPAPGAELSGPATLFVNNARDRIREIDTRIAEIEEQLTGLTAPRVESRTDEYLPYAPEPSKRQIPLQERLNTLAERVVASPRVDDDTKALVREVQDNMPLLMQREPEAVGAWLYRTLQGTAPADLTQSIRDRLAELEAGRRSETEQVTERVRRPITAAERQATAGTSLQGKRTVVQPQPSGELRSAAQLELEMPEQLATAFATLQEFKHYLASDTLAAVRGNVGPVRPTAERLERQLEPLRQQAAALRRDQTLLNTTAEVLRQYVPGFPTVGAPVKTEPQKLATALARLDEANTEAIRAAQALLDNQQAFAERVEGYQPPEAPTPSAGFKQYLVRETKLYFELQQQLRRVAGFKAQVSKQRNLIAAAERQANLAAFEQQSRAAATPAEKRAAFTEALAASKAKAAGAVEREVREQEAVAKQRAEVGAERRQPATFAPSGETLSQREARTGQERAAEQARLDREAAGAGTRIEFAPKTELDITQDSNYRVLLERVELAKTREERAAALKAAEEYFNARANKLDASLKTAVRTAAGHLEDLQKAKDRLQKLQERLEKNVTEKGRKMTPNQRAKVERDIEKEKGVIETHQKNYTNSASEVRVKRTDIKAEREAKQRLLADVQRRFEPGQRLGEAEGTTAARAIGPVTRPEVYPPKTMRTGSEESRTGVTTTDARSRLTEARGAQQRDIAMTAKEMQAAQAAAAKMKTLEGLEKAEKALAAEREAASARGLRPGEFDRFEAREAVLKVRRATLARQMAEAKPAEAKPAEAKPEVEQEVEPEAEQRKRAQEANRLAQELAKKPAAQKAKEQQEAAAVQREQAKLRAKPAKVTPLSAEKPARAKGERVSTASAVERLEEELDAFEPEILPGTDEDVFFSRGEADAPSTAASVRAELGKVFPDTKRVQIYDSVDALIAANPQYEGKIPSDARGFVDPASNKAFLIAENIDKGQSLSVLLHEVGAHVGLKKLLGEAQYNALVNAVKAWEKKADGSVESRVAKAARERVGAAETKTSQVDDELLAYTIEEAVNAGVKPLETKGVLGQWLGRVAQLFRRALEKFGLPPKALDAQGLVDMAFGAAKLEMRGGGTPPRGGGKPAGDLLFSRNLPTAARVANQLVAEQPTWLDKLKANFLGTGFRTQFIDKLDPVEKALKRGKVEELKAAQALFYLRMYDQRMHYTSQAVYEGAPAIVEKTRRDGRTERMIEAQPGANLKQVADIMLKPAVVKAAGSADAANKLFTLYLAAIRGTRVGFDKLNFGHAWATAEIARIESQLESSTLSPEMRSNLQKKRASLEKRLASMPTEADIKAAKAEIDADPVLSVAFQEARDVYNAYNRNLMHFAIDTGAIGQERGAKLLASNDYVPYYRMRDGVAELVIGSETPIRIGNLKDSPHLQELVGGDEAIFDFMTSSVQNTSLLIDMSMRNLATKNLMFELRDVGLAKISKVKGGNAPTGSVTFQKDGDEYFAVVDTDALGIDSELLVKGLAGIPTMFPTFVRLFGIPARLLRRLVVISPVYMARQLVRDTTAAAIASGANITPVVSALRQIGKDSVLERRGITGGMVFTGMPEDQARLLKDMQTGKLSIASGMARMEALSAKVDALAREAQYESYREQGLSEMEATLMALESMNFSRRGLSPTMHMVSTLIPFFNAQVQGLDVLYRSFRGDMPFNERLQVREKLWKRGMFLFGMSMLYATLMQDDEAYKNAKVEEKYGNFFVPVPGTEQLLRVPIPFELGYIFKALPEALVNTLANEEGGTEALKALQHIAKQTVPGLSSYFLPQAIKPALEVAFDTSTFTGRDIESAKEKLVEPGYRYRDSTTELAKEVGEATGFSPVKMEYLIRGYTGSMGMAALAALSAPFGSSGPEGPTKRPSDIPVVGTLFQPTDASGIVDLVYERMNKARQVQETYESLIKKGRPEAAQQYLNENLDDFVLATLGGSFKQQMGEITKYEQAIRASSMTPEQKRAALDQARQAKISLAKAVREASGRTERQTAPA